MVWLLGLAFAVEAIHRAARDGSPWVWVWSVWLAFWCLAGLSSAAWRFVKGKAPFGSLGTGSFPAFRKPPAPGGTSG
jgi:hypothetical protein